MSIFKQIKNNLIKIIHDFRNLSQYMNKIQFRIEEINFVEHRIILHIIGKNAVLKISIIDFLEDVKMIQGISSEDACFLGYHYAMILLKYPSKNTDEFIMNKKSFFELNNDNSHYRIHCQFRNGHIQYIHLNTHAVYCSDPANMIKDKDLISRFNQSQACHIGMLGAKRLFFQKNKKLNNIIQLKKV